MNISKFDSNKFDFVKEIVNSDKSEKIEAFYVCDTNEIKARHNQMMQHNQNIQPIYTVKCNSDLELLKILSGLNMDFDCASKNEITKVLALNINPNRIVCGNPVKQISQIKYAAEHNISKLIFDNKTELIKIKSHHPHAKLVLRIRHSGDKGIIKFGCKDKSHAEDLLNIAKSYNLDVIGVCFNTNLECNMQDFEQTLNFAKDIFIIGREIGFDFNFLDLGNIPLVDQTYNTIITKYFEDDLNKIKIYARSDRFLVGSSFVLATKVHSKRTPTHNNEQLQMYYIGDGIFGSFNILILHDFPHLLNPKPLYDGKNDHFCTSSFMGISCAALDVVIKQTNKFPVMNIGEWVIFENMGVYSRVMCSHFQGIPIPPVFYIS